MTFCYFTAINPEQQQVIINQYFLHSDKKAQYGLITTPNKQTHNHSQNITRQKGAYCNITAINPEQQHIMRNQSLILKDKRAQYGCQESQTKT